MLLRFGVCLSYYWFWLYCVTTMKGVIVLWYGENSCFKMALEFLSCVQTALLWASYDKIIFMAKQVICLERLYLRKKFARRPANLSPSQSLFTLVTSWGGGLRDVRGEPKNGCEGAYLPTGYGKSCSICT